MDHPTDTRLHTDGAITRLYPRGELDCAGLAALRRRLQVALTGTSDGGCLVVDLTDVEFMDCSALGVVIRAGREASRRRIAVHLVGDSGPVTRLLQLTQAQGTLSDIWYEASKRVDVTPRTWGGDDGANN